MINNDAYTYFELKSGLLCYTYGYDARYDDKHMVCSTVGYLTPSSTGRVQTSSGRNVQKFIYEGNELELDTDKAFLQAPEEIKYYIKNHLRIHQSTGEQLFVIPNNSTDITIAYDPRQALNNIIKNEQLIGEKQKIALVQAIHIFNTYGIETSDLGVYGSLQTGIVTNSLKTDIDILVYGKDNYQKIVNLSEKHSTRGEVASKYTNINNSTLWKRARDKRTSLSQVRLDDATHIDIKMVRKPPDELLLDFQNLKMESDLVELEGIVIDASSGLMTPSTYQIESHGTIYTVGTRLYVYLGAALRGNRVRIKGRKVAGQNSVIIADQKEHFIHALD
jgi:predicted nucleotidyltransferase